MWYSAEYWSYNDNHIVRSEANVWARQTCITSAHTETNRFACVSNSREFLNKQRENELQHNHKHSVCSIYMRSRLCLVYIIIICVDICETLSRFINDYIFYIIWQYWPSQLKCVKLEVKLILFRDNHWTNDVFSAMEYIHHTGAQM